MDFTYVEEEIQVPQFEKLKSCTDDYAAISFSQFFYWIYISYFIENITWSQAKRRFSSKEETADSSPLESSGVTWSQMESLGLTWSHRQFRKILVYLYKSIIKIDFAIFNSFLSCVPSDEILISLDFERNIQHLSLIRIQYIHLF